MECIYIGIEFSWFFGLAWAELTLYLLTRGSDGSEVTETADSAVSVGSAVPG